MNFANFEVVSNSLGEPLVIRDIGPWERHMTVTNDVEAVVRNLVGRGLLPEGRRLLYFDSDGNLDQILVSEGKFAGFRPASNFDRERFR